MELEQKFFRLFVKTFRQACHTCFSSVQQRNVTENEFSQGNVSIFFRRFSEFFRNNLKNCSAELSKLKSECARGAKLGTFSLWKECNVLLLFLGLLNNFFGHSCRQWTLCVRKNFQRNFCRKANVFDKCFGL